jgi:hypothetical protein
MEDKIVIFIIATVIVIALLLAFTIPAIVRHSRKNTGNQEEPQK